MEEQSGYYFIKFASKITYVHDEVSPQVGKQNQETLNIVSNYLSQSKKSTHFINKFFKEQNLDTVCLHPFLVEILKSRKSYSFRERLARHLQIFANFDQQGADPKLHQVLINFLFEFSKVTPKGLTINCSGIFDGLWKFL